MASLMTLSDELLYLILQHLHGPRRPNQALCNANHVCRRLHGVSQSFLFEHVAIYLDTIDDEFEPLAETKNPARRWIDSINLTAASRLQRLMTLLEQSGAFSLVRCLTLHLPHDQCSTPVALELEKLVKRLINLRSIHLPQNICALSPTNLQEIESINPSLLWHIDCFNPRVHHRSILLKLQNISSLKAIIGEGLEGRVLCGNAFRLLRSIRSTSRLVSDICLNNPHLTSLSLQLLRPHSTAISNPRFLDEEAHAIERLGPVLYPIRNLELKGYFQIPNQLWSLLNLDYLTRLSLYNLNVIRSFAENLSGKVPALRQLKISAYPSSLLPRSDDILTSDVEILCDPLQYMNFKDTLIKFLMSTRIESITLCHFSGDIVWSVCNVLGPILRRFDAHQDSRPLNPLLAGISPNGPLLRLGNFEVIAAVASKISNLEHLGIDIRWVEILLLRPGGYKSEHFPSGLDTLSLINFSHIPPPPPPDSPGISAAEPPPLIRSPPTPTTVVLSIPPPSSSPPSPWALTSVARFPRLKQLRLVIHADYDPDFRNVTDEDIVRAFCYIRDKKAGVPFECLEIFFRTRYTIWENGDGQCILSRHESYREGTEQVWDTRSLKLVEKRKRRPKPAAELWGMNML